MLGPPRSPTEAPASSDHGEVLGPRVYIATEEDEDEEEVKGREKEKSRKVLCVCFACVIHFIVFFLKLIRLEYVLPPV